MRARVAPQELWKSYKKYIEAQEWSDTINKHTKQDPVLVVSAIIMIIVPAILLIPLGDALITWSAPGGTATGAATHLAGTICVGILCACTWLDPTLSSTVHDKSKR